LRDNTQKKKCDSQNLRQGGKLKTKKLILTLTIIGLLAMMLALPVSAAPTGAASGSRGYLIGSAAPLTAAQVGQLR
jgi:hypothetical protein